MNRVLGIRREDKNVWERRTPLAPAEVEKLVREEKLRVLVQPSEIRTFLDEEYRKAGAEIQEHLTPAQVIFAVKEIPAAFFEKGKTYVFFSHTVKGQKYNMPMLQKLLDLKCNLIDYEKITDENGKRLIFFGKYAGLAGMLDTLWALGEKLKVEGVENPFSQLLPAHKYPGLAAAKKAVQKVAEAIWSNGLPATITPLICAFLGYGNVATGAQEIYDLLAPIEITPQEVFSLYKSGKPERNKIFKVVFKEADLVEPVEPDALFELSDYYQHPEKYRSIFYRYLPYLSLIVNGVYWDKQYPRFVSREALAKLYQEQRLPLKVIGDISCDIEGSMECTLKATCSDNPVYTYHPQNQKINEGVKKNGIVIMAVDNLPCELPKESSEIFSRALLPLVPAIVKADYSRPFASLNLPPELKKAVIVYQGELTPDYQYLEKHLPAVEEKVT